MRMSSYYVKINGEDKKVYTIEEGPKKEMENENYNYDRYLLINQHLFKLLKLRCYQDRVMFSEGKTIKVFDNKYVYFPIKEKF